MIGLTLLALALADAGSSARPCVPVASDHLKPTPSAIEDHKSLRAALGVPMPQAPTMVMLYGKGGHLSTEEYSIVLIRAADRTWRGTAVGRSQIWVQDAPYEPMKEKDWALDKAAAEKLEHAISLHCQFDRAAASGTSNPPPPPRGYISERVDVLTPNHAPITFYASEGDGKIAQFIRPPN